MRERKFLYAYRMSSQEMGHPYWTQGKFHDMVRTYVQQKNISRNAWLLESCMDSKLGQDRHAGNVPMLAPSTSTDHFTVARCGPLNGPYNNFFISKVSFWMQPSVQDFLRYINSSNSIYFERFNDILWHGAAMRLFMPSRRVHIFRDFAYEHVTFKVRQVGNATQTCMGYGGLAFGSVAGVDAQPAVERLHELDRQLRWQEHEIAESVKAGSYNFYHWCPRSTPCYAVVNGGSPGAPSVDAGYLLGSVGLEYLRELRSELPVLAVELLGEGDEAGGVAGHLAILVRGRDVHRLQQPVVLRRQLRLALDVLGHLGEHLRGGGVQFLLQLPRGPGGRGVALPAGRGGRRHGGGGGRDGGRGGVRLGHFRG